MDDSLLKWEIPKVNLWNKWNADGEQFRSFQWRCFDTELCFVAQNHHMQRKLKLHTQPRKLCIYISFFFFLPYFWTNVSRETNGKRRPEKKIREKRDDANEEQNGSHYHGWFGERACTPMHHRHRRFRNLITTLVEATCLQLEFWKCRFENGKMEEGERKSLEQWGEEWSWEKVVNMCVRRGREDVWFGTRVSVTVCALHVKDIALYTGFQTLSFCHGLRLTCCHVYTYIYIYI